MPVAALGGYCCLVCKRVSTSKGWAFGSVGQIDRREMSLRYTNKHEMTLPFERRQAH